MKINNVMKNNVRLTESQLKKIISESVKRVLKESSDNLGWSDEVWDMFQELEGGLGSERLCREIAGKLDEKTLQMILKRIYMEYDFNGDEEEF